MQQSIFQSFSSNFLGNSPSWYKTTVLGFLMLNPLLLLLAGTFITGWTLILEFIFTLAMALKCYPLQPGGLLALEAVLLGMAKYQPEDIASLQTAVTSGNDGEGAAHHLLELIHHFPSTASVIHEIQINLPVILLLMFMVAGIYFMRDLLLFTFTKILVNVRSKMLLSLMFCSTAAVLSAFLDALTVTAVLISVMVGFYSVYHKVASGKKLHQKEHDHGDDGGVREFHRDDLEQFRGFLRSLVMHGAVGTALGGVTTLVGEPQNLLIAEKAGWDFVHFFLNMAPITIPVVISGLALCMALEKLRWFGYGATIPESVRQVLYDFNVEESARRGPKENATLSVQAVVAVVLVFSLAFHLSEVGLIGLMVIVLLTAFNGITEEHQIGRAFEEALPFTALLVVFFTIVAVIQSQHLFRPITSAVLHMDQAVQPAMFFIANGLLSAISDNVFVATVYIDEVRSALDAGSITREHFDKLAIAINIGTNIPSVATPNGQAAFLFLLTSALAPLIRLSYGRMVVMALPYTLVLSSVAILFVLSSL